MRKKRIKKAQSIGWITGCLLLLLSLGFAPLNALHAQATQKATSKLIRLYIPNEKVRSSDRQKISIKAEKEPMLSVLKRVANEVNVGISYQEGLIPNKNITIHIEDTPLFQALKVILKGTGLQAILPFSRDVLIIKKKQLQTELQTGSITGTVTNEDGEPVPTANVLLVEINRGAATNLEGEYTIEDVEVGTYTLRVSFVGYKTYRDQVTIEAGEMLVKDIVLQTGAVNLKELVVTGYGVETRASLTGAVTSVQMEEVQRVPVQNTGSLLQGRVAGVVVTSTSGSPGSGFNIQIRGAGSINANTRPLYIVDGVQVSFSNRSENQVDVSPLNVIDPDNIASIEVLKDAAATAIYGAQGANGVVLITTKSGQPGQTEITFSASRGAVTPILSMDRVNTEQWLELTERAAAYRFKGRLRRTPKELIQDIIFLRYGYPAGAPAFIDGTERLVRTPYSQIHNTDWFDFIYRRGVTQEYDLSFSGGSNQTTFYIAGGYEYTEGQIKKTDFRRFSLRTNINHDFTEKFSLGLNLGITESRSRAHCQDGSVFSCPFSKALMEVPITFPYLENGDYNPNVLSGLDDNIAVLLDLKDHVAQVFHLLGDLSTTYDFAPWLSLQAQVGMDYRNTRNRAFEAPIATFHGLGEAREVAQYIASFNTSAVLSFRQSFGESHSVSGLIGGEYRRDFTREIEAQARNFPGTLFEVIGAGANPTVARGFVDEFRIAGYFANLKYNYEDRYFISGTLRYDGSSRFGRENRWGFFPAVSAAWVISEEDFFNAGFVNFLKLRASYGVAGNSRIGRYAALGLYEVDGSYSGRVGLNPEQLANPILTWEESKQANIGLDATFFIGRLSATVNVYQKINEGLLLETPLPVSTSFENIVRNAGKVRNRGIEFSMSSININTQDFRWATRFQVSIAKNEVLALSKGVQMLFPGALQPIAVGHSIGALHIIEYAGVNPVDGRPMWYTQDGKLTYNPVFNRDAEFHDGGEEDVTGGLGTTFSYKGLTLDVFFQFMFGKHAFPESAWEYISEFGEEHTPTLVKMLTQSWQNPGDYVPIPAPIWGTERYPGTRSYANILSTQSFYDASYMRLKTARLSYSLPTSITEAIDVSNVMLYVSGLNLVTWTSWPGVDPEVPGTFVDSSYPSARRITGGIEINF